MNQIDNSHRGDHSMSALQPTDRERLATLEANYLNLIRDIDNLVTKDEFGPVKLLTYSTAGIILTSVMVSALGHLFIK